MDSEQPNLCNPSNPNFLFFNERNIMVSEIVLKTDTSEIEEI